VTRQSIELQRQAVQRQEQLGRTYQRVILTGGIVGLALLFLLGALLMRWGSRLF
jgi:hypothetical protein